ncbi:MAG TPA: hypothetical protein VF406_15600 [Thermodesulfobacteriota bacterium]
MIRALPAAAALLAFAGAAHAQSDAPPAEPTVLARVECRSLEGPCEYRYGVANPAGAADPATGFALLESGEATVRASAGWDVRQEAGTIRWEGGSDGVSAGWMRGGFLLSSECLPRVALAEVRTRSAVRSVPTLVPGSPAAALGSATDLVQGLLDQLPALAGMGWIRSGPARGLLAGRLRTIVEFVERGQETEALRRMRSLAAEVQRLAPAVAVPSGATPGVGRPLLTSGAPLAPEVRDLFAATLGLAMARLGALR